jgi:hypothetical protein
MYHQPAAPPRTPLQVQRDRMMQEAPYFVPLHPWRTINGLTTQTRGPQWVQIVGKVASVKAGKYIVLDGWYGAPMTWPGNDAQFETVEVGGVTNFIPTGRHFTVTNFPTDLLRSEYITYGDKCVAYLPLKPDISKGQVTYVLHYGTPANAPAPAPPGRAQTPANAPRSARSDTNSTASRAK